jgi:hypothetical protein
MEEKKGEKGERGRWPLKVLGCTERQGKKEGVRGLVPCGGANGEEREAPGSVGDSSVAGISPRPAGMGGSDVTRQGRAAERG